MAVLPRSAGAGNGVEWGLLRTHNYGLSTKATARPEVALWALADDLVVQRIDAGDKRLTAVEWKSGINLRIIELVAPFGGEAEMREASKQH